MDISSKFEYMTITANWHEIDIQVKFLSEQGYRVVSIVSNIMDITHIIGVNSSYDSVSGLMKDTPLATNSMPMMEYKIIGEKEIF